MARTAAKVEHLKRLLHDDQSKASMYGRADFVCVSVFYPKARVCEETRIHASASPSGANVREHIGYTTFGTLKIMLLFGQCCHIFLDGLDYTVHLAPFFCDATWLCFKA